MTSRTAAAERLRALHHGTKPLVLTNVWDVASARLVVERGFSAIATSSSAVAASLGLEDDDNMPVDEAFDVIGRIARAVDVPVSADVEAGYGLAPEQLAERLAAAGAAGCNFEDTDHRGGGLVDPRVQAERIAALRSAADLVVNARVDVFLRDTSHTEAMLVEAVDRARLYLEAGADCVFPILLRDEALIARFVKEAGGPVNIYMRPGVPSISRLAELGVRRVSFGGGMMRVTYGALAAELDRVREDLSTANPEIEMTL